MQIRHLLPIAALAAIAACGKTETSEAAAGCGADGIVASNAWARAAGDGQAMSAAYVELCNGAAGADRLVAVRFDGATAVELHQTTMSDDGVASMTPASVGIELPAGETTALAPGGAHIMLIGVNGELAEGGEATLTLEFESAPPLTVAFDVRARTDTTGHGGH